MIRQAGFLARLFKSTLGVDLRSVFVAGMAAERDCFVAALRGRLGDEALAQVLNCADLEADAYRESRTLFLTERERSYRFFSRWMRPLDFERLHVQNSKLRALLIAQEERLKELEESHG